jgi:hypothetical protein
VDCLATCGCGLAVYHFISSYGYGIWTMIFMEYGLMAISLFGCYIIYRYCDYVVIVSIVI